jgi:glycosidase
VWPRQQQTIVTVNMLSPAVRDYFTAYLKRWMDPNGDGDFSDGADGFRIDHMMDDLDNAGVLTGLFTRFWAPIFRDLRKMRPDIAILAEQYDWGYGEAFLNAGEADMVFAFPIWQAATKRDAMAFADAVTESGKRIKAPKTQLVFLENHDTNRFASSGPQDLRQLKLGAAITLLTGWIPSLYYGQELGMAGEKVEGARAEQLAGSGDDARDIPIRAAMRWGLDSAGENAAWYRADPQAYPLGESHADGDGVSVAEQEARADSLLATYRDLSALRRGHACLARGTTRVAQQQGQMVVLERRADREVCLVAFNFGDKPAAIAWPASGAAFTALLGPGAQVSGGRVEARLPAFGAAVWKAAPGDGGAYLRTQRPVSSCCQ